MNTDIHNLARTLRILADAAEQVAAGVDADVLTDCGSWLGVSEHLVPKRVLLLSTFENSMRELVAANPCMTVYRALHYEDDRTKPYHYANLVRNTAEQVAKECFPAFKEELGLTSVTEEEARLYA